MGHLVTLLDEMGLDEMGLDEMGINPCTLGLSWPTITNRLKTPFPCSLIPRPYARAYERVWPVTQVQILGLTSEFENVQRDRKAAFIRILR